MIRSSYNNNMHRTKGFFIRKYNSTNQTFHTERYFPAKYLYFNGTSTRVDLPSTTAMFSASQDITLEFWINLYSTTDHQRIFAQKGFSSNDFMLSAINSNLTVFMNGGVNSGAGSKYATSDGWIHFALTRKSGTCHFLKHCIYTTFTSDSTEGTSTSNVIGARNNNGTYSSWFNGYLWNMRLWNRVLSQSELSYYSVNDPIASDPSLIAWWPMNEASGTSLTDVTGNGWTGTIVDGSWS